MTGPDAFETYEGDFPFWQAIDAAFRKYLLTANTTDPKTLYYYNQVQPLLLFSSVLSKDSMAREVL